MSSCSLARVRRPDAFLLATSFEIVPKKRRNDVHDIGVVLLASVMSVVNDEQFIFLTRFYSYLRETKLFGRLPLTIDFTVRNSAI